MEGSVLWKSSDECLPVTAEQSQGTSKASAYCGEGICGRLAAETKYLN